MAAGKVLFTTVDRFEHIYDISLPNLNQPYQLPTKGGQLPSDRFLYGLELDWIGRATNPATGGPTAALADGPFSLIDHIDIQGYHRLRATQEDFFNLRMPDIRELNRILRKNSPYVTPTSLSTTASAANDIRFKSEITFPPLGLPLGFQVGYLLDAPNYNALELTAYYADANSIFSGQTTQPTFSSYGSAGGNPVLRVSGKFCMWPGGVPDQSFVPGRVWRYMVDENVSGDIVAGKVASRQFNLPAGFVLNWLLLKTGVIAAGTSGANRAYASLSDTIYQNIKVMVGANASTRFYGDYIDLKGENANHNLVFPDPGFGLISFVEDGAVWEAFDATRYINNANFFLQADVTGAANQGAVLEVEEIRTRPILPSS